MKSYQGRSLRDDLLRTFSVFDYKIHTTYLQAQSYTLSDKSDVRTRVLVVVRDCRLRTFYVLTTKSHITFPQIQAIQDTKTCILELLYEDPSNILSAYYGYYEDYKDPLGLVIRIYVSRDLVNVTTSTAEVFPLSLAAF